MTSPRHRRLLAGITITLTALVGSGIVAAADGEATPADVEAAPADTAADTEAPAAAEAAPADTAADTEAPAAAEAAPAAAEAAPADTAADTEAAPADVEAAPADTEAPADTAADTAIAVSEPPLRVQTVQSSSDTAWSITWDDDLASGTIPTATITECPAGTTPSVTWSTPAGSGGNISTDTPLTSDAPGALTDGRYTVTLGCRDGDGISHLPGSVITPGTITRTLLVFDRALISYGGASGWQPNVLRLQLEKQWSGDPLPADATVDVTVTAGDFWRDFSSRYVDAYPSGLITAGYVTDCGSSGAWQLTAAGAAYYTGLSSHALVWYPGVTSVGCERTIASVPLADGESTPIIPLFAAEPNWMGGGPAISACTSGVGASSSVQAGMYLWTPTGADQAATDPCPWAGMGPLQDRTITITEDTSSLPAGSTSELVEVSCTWTAYEEPMSGTFATLDDAVAAIIDSGAAEYSGGVGSAPVTQCLLHNRYTAPVVEETTTTVAEETTTTVAEETTTTVAEETTTTVVEETTTTTPDRTIPTAGADTSTLLGISAALLSAGGAMVMVRRRRRGGDAMS